MRRQERVDQIKGYLIVAALRHCNGIQARIGVEGGGHEQGVNIVPVGTRLDIQETRGDKYGHPDIQVVEFNKMHTGIPEIDNGITHRPKEAYHWRE